MNNFLQIAIDSAMEAGEILRSYWGKINHIRKKAFYWDLVTEADVASEAYILGAISENFPDHRILSEEAGLAAEGSSAYMWLIDPLDGTTNFTHQYPMVSISIALLKDGIPIVGVIYNPILSELFHASLGEGAKLNKQIIHVSEVDTFENCLLATGFAYDRKETNENNYAEFCHMTQLSQGVRRGGSAALDLAYVAAGRLDGYWERGLKPWDMAAGVLIVQEAGGKITSYENASLDISSGRILATNGHMHNKLSQELQHIARLRHV